MCMALIPALGKQKQGYLSEFKASLIYKVSSWPARATERSTLKQISVKTKKMQQAIKSKDKDPPPNKNKRKGSYREEASGDGI